MPRFGTRDSSRTNTVLTVLILAALAIGGVHASFAAAGTGTISGEAFADLNRNSVRDFGEAPFAGHQLYLFDSAKTAYFGTTLTDAAGRYTFTGLSDGDYVVELEGTSWSTLRRDWVPTTTGSVLPEYRAHLVGSATADFGWRPIVRSTILGAPISTYVGPNQLQVESYNDAVTAREVYDAVALGLVGPEASTVRIRFDLGGDNTATSVSRAPDGRYERFGADVSTSYMSWLDSGDAKLVHEYGHAWSLYHAAITQQDPTLAAYLDARGLTGDPRLDTSHDWSRREMIAEDYRQLLGSPTARTASQENVAIPPAAAVPGLLEFLRDRFTVAPLADAPPVPEPLTISGLTVNPKPVRSSGLVSWSASTSASTTAVIVNAKGVVVRTLARDLATGSGPSSVTWDRMTDKGRRAGKGTYTAKIVGTSPTGAISELSATFSVA